MSIETCWILCNQKNRQIFNIHWDTWQNQRAWNKCLLTAQKCFWKRQRVFCIYDLKHVLILHQICIKFVICFSKTNVLPVLFLLTLLLLTVSVSYVWFGFCCCVQTLYKHTTEEMLLCLITLHKNFKACFVTMFVRKHFLDRVCYCTSTKSSTWKQNNNPYKGTGNMVCYILLI